MQSAHRRGKPPAESVMNFQRCLSFTLGEEAGYQANRKDRGNWLGDVLVGTNLGISAPTLAVWLREHNNITKPEQVAQVMRNLSIDMACAIYLARYWKPIDGDTLPAGVDLMLFDHGVNAGVGNSVRLVQQLVRVEGDGVLGPITLRAIGATDPVWLIDSLHVTQRSAYLAKADFAEFGNSWLKRLDRRAAMARSFAAAHPNTIGDKQ
jgi:lysozyme family protein